MFLETNNFEFGEFHLDAREKVLLRDGKPLPITPKAFQLLFILVENHGHLVEKDELMKSVWADSFVEEGNITFTIGLLRKLLEDDTKNPRFIETVPRRGYRFITDVRRVEIAERESERRKDGETKIGLSANSPFSLSPISHSRNTPSSGAVVALADWRRESDENEPVEEVSSASPKESTEQTAGLKLAPTKPNSESKHAPKYRLPLAAFALAAFLIGASTLSYYFYGSKKASSADGKKSIAVLPLKPINTANRDEIYEIGIADSLIHRLNSTKGFVVRPLSAIRKYADIAQDPIAAGREQQVDYILASNYQLAGGKIKITAQLLNVASGQIEETYKSEKDAGDVFAMQDAIAGEVGNILLARFAVTSSSPTAKRGTTSQEAYLLYLQGRNLTYSPSADNARKASENFEQAVRLDPNFARAYAAMAHAFIASAMMRYGAPREEFEKAREAVTKALELDPNLGEGYAVSGQLKFYYEWDYPAAEKDLLRALELEPNSDLAHKEYATYLAALGRFDEAIAEINTALEIDPNSFIVQQYRGRILYLARRYDEAILQFKRAVEVNENLEMGWIWASYELKGDHAQAFEWFMKSQKRKIPERLELFQNIYQTAGWRGVKQKQFEFQKLNEQQTSTNYYEMARQCAFLGDKEQAFEYLNKAIEKRQGQMFQLNVEPPFDNLRDDPRFQDLLRRVGFTP
jgi:DNA-binding winged helix-turn-helix (wHTH) protein/tetratricopeptide (TPR) repeat protein